MYEQTLDVHALNNVQYVSPLEKPPKKGVF
jgi:hypothetical protein